VTIGSIASETVDLAGEEELELADASRAKRRSRRREFLLAWVIRIVVLGALISSWQVVAAKNIISKAFIGEPSGVWSSFIGLFSTNIVTTDLATTLEETLIGFAMAVTIGVLGGYVLTRSPLLYRAFRPLITGANSVPRIALVPVFIIWFGLGPPSKIANIIVFVSIFVLINSLAAFSNADRDLLLLSRTLGFSEHERMMKFVLPSAVPVLAGTVELALIYSFLGSITGEILGGFNGLGVQLEADANELNTNQYFAILLLIVIVVCTLVQGLHHIRVRLLRWQEIEIRGQHGSS
jgi:NitT/TauT family transport system permease protein